MIQYKVAIQGSASLLGKSSACDKRLCFSVFSHPTLWGIFKYENPSWIPSALVIMIWMRASSVIAFFFLEHERDSSLLTVSSNVFFQVIYRGGFKSLYWDSAVHSVCQDSRNYCNCFPSSTFLWPRACFITHTKCYHAENQTFQDSLDTWWLPKLNDLIVWPWASSLTGYLAVPWLAARLSR